MHYARLLNVAFFKPLKHMAVCRADILVCYLIKLFGNVYSLFKELCPFEIMYSQTSIVRNASDFQLFFELSEFRTYRVGFFRIVGKIRAYKITACSGRKCELLRIEYLPVLRSVKENENNYSD